MRLVVIPMGASQIVVFYFCADDVVKIPRHCEARSNPYTTRLTSWLGIASSLAMTN